MYLLYTEKLLYSFSSSSHVSPPCPAKLENRVMVPKMSVMIFITGAALLLSKQRKSTLCRYLSCWWIRSSKQVTLLLKQS